MTRDLTLSELHPKQFPPQPRNDQSCRPKEPLTSHRSIDLSCLPLVGRTRMFALRDWLRPCVVRARVGVGSVLSGCGNDAASSRWLSRFSGCRHLIMSVGCCQREGRFWLGARGSGSVFARCGCRDKRGRRRGTSCQRLGEAGHGSWYFSLDLPKYGDGGRRRLRRGGYLTCDRARTCTGTTLQNWTLSWSSPAAAATAGLCQVPSRGVAMRPSGRETPAQPL